MCTCVFSFTLATHGSQCSAFPRKQPAVPSLSPLLLAAPCGMWDLVPQPAIKSALLAVKCGVLTTDHQLKVPPPPSDSSSFSVPQERSVKLLFPNRLRSHNSFSNTFYLHSCSFPFTVITSAKANTGSDYYTISWFDFLATLFPLQRKTHPFSTHHLCLLVLRAWPGATCACLIQGCSVLSYKN